MSAVADIKAIPTEFAGVVMRSRTEARWALFFEVLGIDWKYEVEGFDLGSAGSYLPDFWLPEISYWAEVKPREFSEIELRKAELLAKKTGHSCLLLDGTPDARNYWAVDSEPFIPGQPAMHDVIFDNHYPKTEGRLYSNTGMGPFEIERHDHDGELAEACRIAKFARFGEGEDPRMMIPRNFLGASSANFRRLPK